MGIDKVSTIKEAEKALKKGNLAQDMVTNIV